MSNIIRLHSNHRNNNEWLHMSNGGTAAFLSILALSGSRLAKEEKEKELILWFVEQDDTVKGRGCNGFDICEMPWEYENFERERKFILKVIEAAKEKYGWESLNYEPNEEFMFTYLDTFKRLINDFEKQYIDKNRYTNWLKERETPQFCLPEGFPYCDERDKKLGLEAIKEYDELILQFKQYLNKEIYDKWVIK